MFPLSESTFTLILSWMVSIATIMGGLGLAWMLVVGLTGYRRKPTSMLILSPAAEAQIKAAQKMAKAKKVRARPAAKTLPNEKALTETRKSEKPRSATIAMFPAGVRREMGTAIAGSSRVEPTLF